MMAKISQVRLVSWLEPTGTGFAPGRLGKGSCELESKAEFL